VWSILKSAVEGYIAHGALSRGAAMAFYVVTSLAPVLLIVVAVAGIVFGQDAVRGSLVQQLGGLFGQQSGELIQSMLASSSDKKSGATASVLGAVAVLITASGVFSEMQTGASQGSGSARPLDVAGPCSESRAGRRARLFAHGFVGCEHSACGAWRVSRQPDIIRAAGPRGTQYAHFPGSLHAPVRSKGPAGHAYQLARGRHRCSHHRSAVYDRQVPYRLVSRHNGREFRVWAAGALVLVLLWAYYCTQTFLFGAELTRAIAGRSAELETAPNTRKSRTA
jgi:membrane protein